MSSRVRQAETPYLRSGSVADFSVGDTVDVATRIAEGDKERIQVFNGVVIRRRGTGLSETFTVRRIVMGEGVERIFPVHSPRISSVKIVRRGEVRRAKLYYLRDRVGKATRLREAVGADEASAAPAKERETSSREGAKPRAREHVAKA